MAQYTAPDGSTFAELKAYQKHIFNTYLHFHDQNGQTLIKNPGEIAGQEFQLSNLADCEVLLLDNSDRIIATQLTNCKVLIGPSSESVVLRNLSNCEITVACKELRLSDCVDCIIHVYSVAGTTIETCSGIQFGTFNGAYSGLTSQFSATGFDPAQHKADVTDFSKRDTEIPEPHFSMIEGDSAAWDIQVPGALGEPENPTLPGAPATGAEPPAPLNPLPPLQPGSPVEAAPTEDFGAAQSEFLQEGTFETAPAEQDMFAQDANAFEGAPTEQNTFVQEQDAFEQHPVEGEQFDATQHPANSDPFAPGATAGVHDDEDPFGDSISGAEDAFDAAPNDFENQSATDAFGEAHPEEPPVEPEQTAVMSDDEEEDESAAYKSFLKQFDERVQALDAEHQKKREEMKDEAEEALEEHYSTRTNNNAIRAAANRENEQDLLESIKKDNENSQENPWAKVLSLVDLTVDPAESADKSRMRSLLLQLKSAQGKKVDSM